MKREKLEAEIARLQQSIKEATAAKKKRQAQLRELKTTLAPKCQAVTLHAHGYPVRSSGGPCGRPGNYDGLCYAHWMSKFGHHLEYGPQDPRTNEYAFIKCAKCGTSFAKHQDLKSATEAFKNGNRSAMRCKA